ncbi:molybdate ABC transporter substrate-binding protein [Flavobacteriaceae bacterium R38]|nr:molybdate ABC transporter substrate-binding protein [Flavobacteriaceae bacterium R38]
MLKRIILLLIVLCTACNTKNDTTITIATAANMQFAMKALTEAFTLQSGIKCELVVSSSGKLTAQIKEGAPYDIFVAANMKYPNEVYNSGFAEAPPEIYAYGKLVLWTNIENITPLPEYLTDASVKHIALANHTTAPYGTAAIEVLKSKKLLDTIEEKLVYGESVSQVNQFITSKSAEVGFTALSVVLSRELENKGKWTEIDQGLYRPIAQGIVLLKSKEEKKINSKAFYTFLFSDEAKLILKNFGYSVNE